MSALDPGKAALEGPEGEVEVALAREGVALQLYAEMTETTYGSSLSVVGRRFKTVVEARDETDRHVVRAALFDLAVACAAYAAILDVELPENAGRKRRKRPRPRSVG